MNLRLERLAKLTRGCAESDGCPASGHGVDPESLPSEPVLHSSHVVRAKPKPAAEFLWREPRVITRRVRILLIVVQLCQCRGLRRRCFEAQLNALNAMVIRQRSVIFANAVREFRVPRSGTVPCPYRRPVRRPCGCAIAIDPTRRSREYKGGKRCSLSYPYCANSTKCNGRM